MFELQKIKANLKFKFDSEEKANFFAQLIDIFLRSLNQNSSYRKDILIDNNLKSRYKNEIINIVDKTSIHVNIEEFYSQFVNMDLFPVVFQLITKDSIDSELKIDIENDKYINMYKTNEDVEFYVKHYKKVSERVVSEFNSKGFTFLFNEIYYSFFQNDFSINSDFELFSINYQGEEILFEIESIVNFFIDDKSKNLDKLFAEINHFKKKLVNDYFITKEQELYFKTEVTIDDIEALNKQNWKHFYDKEKNEFKVALILKTLDVILNKLKEMWPPGYYKKIEIDFYNENLKNETIKLYLSKNEIQMNLYFYVEDFEGYLSDFLFENYFSLFENKKTYENEFELNKLLIELTKELKPIEKRIFALFKPLLREESLYDIYRKSPKMIFENGIKFPIDSRFLPLLTLENYEEEDKKISILNYYFEPINHTKDLLAIFPKKSDKYTKKLCHFCINSIRKSTIGCSNSCIDFIYLAD